jgi:hypothetical protein
MALIAFYFLLRVGEYTSTAKTTKKLTQAFWIQDVTLWDNNAILDHSLPLDALLNRCTAAPQRPSAFPIKRMANETKQSITKQHLPTLALQKL